MCGRKGLFHHARCCACCRYQTRVRAEERRLMAAVAEAEEDEQVGAHRA